MRNYFLILFALLFFTQSVFSKEYSIENINIKEGLPNSIVNCIVQDDLGFLWIGTSTGLCRYDGYNFELIPLKNGIGNEDIRQLKLDSNNHLWISALGRPLMYYNINQEAFVKLKINQENIFNNITAIELQNDSVLWVGTKNGLIKYDISKKRKNEIELNQKAFLLPDKTKIKHNNNFITTIKKHKDRNSIWVGTNSNLFKLNTISNEFNKIKTYNKWAVRSISQISEEQLIIGFWNSGILRIDNEGNHVKVAIDELIEKEIGSFRILSFLKENEKSYWIGTRGKGAFNFIINNNSININQFKYNPNKTNSIGSNAVSCITIDKSNVIWLGQINSGGLSKVKSGRYQLSYKKETANLNVNSIFVRSEYKMWVGTQAKGLIYFDFQKNHNVVFNKKTLQNLNGGYSTIEKIHEDREGNFWIGTHGNGVHIIPKKRIEEIEKNGRFDKLYYGTINKMSNPEFNDYIMDICSDTVGNVWIGTSQGLFIVNPQFSFEKLTENKNNNQQLLAQNYFKDDPLFEKLDIFSLYIDNKGFLWVSTKNKGVLKINPNKRTKIEVYNFTKNGINSLQSNKIFNCKQDKYDRIWVNSSKGIDIIDPKDNSVKPALTSKQIGNNEVLNLTFDNSGEIWLGLSYGIYNFNFEKKEIRKYYRASEYGNFNNVNSIFNSNDGIIYMGSRDGVTFFKPTDVSKSKIDIPFYITSFKINNIKIKPGQKVSGRVVIEKNINKTDEITLKNSDRNISFDIASLDYFDRSSIEYKYLLEGSSSIEWTILNQGQHTLSFSNLRKGNYNLRIKATNSYGVWSPKEISLKIKVLPPFWQSNIAIGIYSIILILLLYMFYWFSIILEKEKNKLKLNQLEKERLEELNNLKLQFFTNISHEFRTPLSLIITPLESIIDKIKTPDTLQQLNLIKRNANRLLFLINQIIDIRKIDTGNLKLSLETVNLITFSNDIFKLFQTHAIKKQITFSLKSTNENIFVKIDQHYFESVLYNIISNAFRFTNPNDQIKLNIYTRKQYACISISDTGKGIPKDQIGNVLETFYHSTEQGKEWVSAGIGLSFSKSIIDLHNGEIEIISEEGKGSTFIVKIPLLTKNDLALKESPTIELHKTKLSRLSSVLIEEKEILEKPNLHLSESKKEFTILVVEDDYELRKYVSDELKRKYNILEAENGKIGWELVQSEKPHLVVTDLIMPKIDGLELCNLIKNSDKYSHIPVIILTAKNLEEDKIMGYKKGADAYIFKPFKFQFLSLRIENLLAFKSKVKTQLSNNIYITKNKKIESKDQIFIDKTIALVEDNISNSEFYVGDIYKKLGYSRTNLYRKIKKITGYSVKEFVREIRLQSAAQMLRDNDFTVNEVAFSTGFASVSYFSKCFKKRFNASPVNYKKEYITFEKINFKL